MARWDLFQVSYTLGLVKGRFVCNVLYSTKIDEWSSYALQIHFQALLEQIIPYMLVYLRQVLIVMSKSFLESTVTPKPNARYVKKQLLGIRVLYITISHVRWTITKQFNPFTQVFHMCQPNGNADSFLCPNGTMFNQQYFVCDWWYNVDCQAQPTFYGLNEFIYTENEDGK